ncbi:MAG: ABC transporter substrate-binding protein [Candidatus Rokubacteria bacterium]|nr:ABC transporter substrate-binding protein [Candidatus Rokubacteria bacterium]
MANALIALLILALFLVAPFRSEPASGKPEGTVVIGMRAELTTLNQAAGSIPEITVGENIFETLVYRNFDGSVRPHLAERWTLSPDGLTYTFHLRKGVKFHNGEPFNAQAVKYSIEWIRDPSVFSQFKGYWTTVKTIEIVDDSTIKIQFTQPYPILISLLPWHLPILPPKYVSENRATWGRKPVGTGPYRFVEWIPNERIVMDANLDYWQGPPPFQRLIFRPIPDETARTAALLSGAVHVVGPLSLDQTPMVSATPGVHVVWTDSLQRERVAIRHDVKPFDDVRVRQAVAHAIDKPAIIKNILGGNATDIHGPLVGLEWGFDAGLKEAYPYNPGRAKALLAQAGHAKGIETEFEYAPGITAKNTETAEAIVNYLAAVGIKAKLRALDYGKYISKSKNRELAPLSTSFWTGGGNFHGWQTFAILLDCEKSSALWNPKPRYWCNAEIDKLIASGVQALHGRDETKARQLFAQAQKAAADHVYQAWLWQFREPWGVSNRLKFKPKGNNDVIMSWDQAGWNK